MLALATVIPTPVTTAENARFVHSRRLLSMMALLGASVASGALFDTIAAHF